jgi:transcription-repair coupling factor (superfamily II helicase)
VSSAEQQRPLGELEHGFGHPLEETRRALAERGVAHLSGLEGGFAALVLAQVLGGLSRPLVVVTPTLNQAREMAGDLAAFGLGRVGHEVLVIPPPDVSPYGEITPDRARVLERLNSQFRLNMGDDVRALVLPIDGAMRKLIPWRSIESATTSLSVGETGVDVEALRRLLQLGGYNAVRVVEDPGTFAVRGGLVDIYCPLEGAPVRIDLFGDQIESIKRFDPQTQRTLDDIESIYIAPAREELLTEEALVRARRRLRQRGDEQGLPSELVNGVLRDLESGFQFFGIESLLPALYDLEPTHELLPKRALLALVAPQVLHEQAEDLWERRHGEFERYVGEAEGIAFPPEAFFEKPRLLFEALEARQPRIELHRVAPPHIEPLDFRFHDDAEVVRLRKAHEETEGTVHALVRALQRWRDDYGRIAFACRNDASADRLAALLRSYGQAVERVDGAIPIDHAPPPAGALEVYVGQVSAGFRSPALGLVVIPDASIFGRAARKSQARVVEESLAISHFRELGAGDLVVHKDFGIARYHGIEQLVLDGIAGDYLKLEFAGADKLYLPVYRLGRVQKYAAADEGVVGLDKLGGTRWEAAKAKVRVELQALAVELLRIYAERAARQGTPHPAPGELYRELEASFPYEETPHQARAIEEVLDDMTSVRPMDRLICGDVGFGKTEVAVRAAFLSVAGGRQVAVLVPTTILAEQHGRTFRDRLADTGVRVETLSRFRSAKQVADILADTEAGKVDILVGTHRILGKDVVFRSLGLVVIDEEQRFGVQHKEKLKKLRKTVDVLTMTATPIPRTMEMSLLGIRDLSVILTPPADRLAVRTYVAHYGETVVREGIEAELRRGGQVFFVHNRVEGIHEIANEIRQAVPEAKVIVGHAQMADGELEKVMSAFLNREADVLVSTTIVESGLDIASANTIFINRADAFGLAQLYQLRGRVGRGKERGFCYLLVPRRRRLPKDAARRLEVIRTHTELGSGLYIAQHDLDIRGAGNLLGKDQSGHIRTIGYDLFCELLEETIREQRGEAVEREIEPEVNIPVSAYIPTDYIPDEGLRLLFYKRLSMARSEEDLEAVMSELVDRFGRYPREVFHLREIVGLKVTLTQLYIEKVEAGPAGVVLTLSEACRLSPDKVIELVREERGRWALREDMRLVRRLSEREGSDLLEATRQALERVRRCAY